MAGNIKNVDFVLEKLIHKQKLYTYQIAKLEYKIYVGLVKLEQVNLLINKMETNIKSLNAAIIASGDGEIKDKLVVWKIKAEYQLFKLGMRKNKIDVVKLILNQSKLEEVKQALIVVNQSIKVLQNPSLEETNIEYLPIATSNKNTESITDINLYGNFNKKTKSNGTNNVDLKLAS